MRRRKEKRKEEASKSSTVEENEVKLAQPEKVYDNVKRPQEEQKLKTPKTSKPNPILSQIPRYVYLVAIFALLSGVFFPLITTGVEDAFSFVIGGTAILFLGLIGGILIFKAATSNKSQVVPLAIGFTLLAISLTLIFLIKVWWQEQFILI
jgi:uncharacterized membrane protein